MIISNLPALDTSDTTAAVGDVLQGKYFYNNNSELVQGTLVPSVAPTYTVTTAGADDVAYGTSFYKATSTSTVTLTTGSLADRRGAAQVAYNVGVSSANNRIILRDSENSIIDGSYGIYTSFSDLVSANNTTYISDNTKKIQASNIKSGCTILGVAGSYTPSLVTKTITSNGTYNASSDNADGYSQVTVAIPLYDKSFQ